MTGRLRIIMVEADGEGAKAAIEAAMAVFAPERTLVLPKPEAPAAAEPAIAAQPEPAQRRKKRRQPRAEPKARSVPRAAGESLELNKPGFMGVTVEPGAGQVTRDGKTARLAGPPLRIVALAVGESNGVVSREVAKREIWSGSPPKWADQMLNGYARDANARLKPLGLELAVYKAAINGWQLGELAG